MTDFFIRKPASFTWMTNQPATAMTAPAIKNKIFRCHAACYHLFFARAIIPFPVVTVRQILTGRLFPGISVHETCISRQEVSLRLIIPLEGKTGATAL
jgi:hypothetical protein